MMEVLVYHLGPVSEEWSCYRTRTDLLLATDSKRVMASCIRLTVSSSYSF